MECLACTLKKNMQSNLNTEGRKPEAARCEDRNKQNRKRREKDEWKSPRGIKMWHHSSE
jgi:hypothetical protein